MNKKALFTFLVLLSILMVSAFPALANEGGGGYTSEQWNGFFWRTANFVVFAVILFFLLKKPVTTFFRGRRENIARTLEYLETQAKNLEEQNQVLSRKLADLASERDVILAQYEKDGAKERDRIIAQAQKTAESIIRKTEVAMDQEIIQAKRLLTAETGALATRLAGDLLVKSITNEDQSRLRHDFMEQVTKLPARN